LARATLAIRQGARYGRIPARLQNAWHRSAITG
jgi:hypothetical protein